MGFGKSVMQDYTLVIANKNYSSWSLRGWLMLKATGVPFREIVVPLDQPETRETILRHSPSGKVPVLKHGSIAVWDSLAIGEYLHERHPACRLWPADPEARATARSVSAEMHSSFVDLRRDLPMNIRGRFPGRKSTPATADDIARVVRLWRTCRRQFGEKAALDEGYLFGHFSIADAMFAPVATRFRTYDVPVDTDTATYIDRLLSNPAVMEWSAAALAETWRIPKYEFA